MKDKYDVVVIGGGMAGLTCAAWLAKKGLEVILLEKENRVGGLCASYKKENCVLQPGATIISGCEDGFFKQLLTELKIADKLNFISLPYVFKYYIPGYEILEDRDISNYVNTLINLFPQSSEKIKEFFGELEQIWKELERLRLQDELSVSWLKRSIVSNYSGKTVTQVIDKMFTDEKLKAILMGAAASMFALPPSDVSFISYAMILMQWHKGGVFAVKGGMQNLADAFKESIELHGGEVELQKPVSKILLEDGKAYAVRLADGEEIQCKYVVGAINVFRLFLNLIGINNVDIDTVKYLREARLPYPMFSVSLAAKGVNIEPTYCCYSPVYNLNEWYTTIEKNMFSIDAQVVINAVPVADDSLAPQGAKTLTLFLPVPYKTRASWPSLKERMTKVLIRRAEKVLPGLSGNIIAQDSATPLNYEKYTDNEMGSMTGFAEVPKFAFGQRLSNKTFIENLFICGQWAQPGMGVNSAIISGLRASKFILKKEGMDPLRELGL